MPARARKARQRKPAPPYMIGHRVVRLRPGTPDATTWPWPFGERDEDGPAWKARYAPERLTRADLFELAGIADTYHTMITHPSRGLADTIHDLRRVLVLERDRACELATPPDPPTLTSE